MLAPPSSLTSSPAFFSSFECAKFISISGYCPCFVLDPSHHTGLKSKFTSLTIPSNVVHPQLLLVTLPSFTLFSKHFPSKITLFRPVAFICLVCHYTLVSKKSNAWYVVSAQNYLQNEGRKRGVLAMCHAMCFGLSVTAVRLHGLAFTCCLHIPPSGRYLHKPPQCTRH